MVDVFHASGLYLFSAASIAEAREKCTEQGLKPFERFMRRGILTLYVEENRNNNN